MKLEKTPKFNPDNPLIKYFLTLFRAIHEKNLQRFETRYRQALEQLPELIEIGLFDTPRPLDPLSLGMSHKTYEDLSPDQLKTVRTTIFKFLDITEHLEYRVDTATPSPQPPVPGRIKIIYFETKFPDLLLQELYFSDNQRRWVLGPDENL